MNPPIRSPRQQTGGIFVFARILDKIRLHAAGKLPEGYHLGVISGKRTFDDRICRFLDIRFEALSAKTLKGGSDEEILAWCFANGKRPDEEQIEVWNAFISKRGWKDSASLSLENAKNEAGLENQTDIFTFFDLMDAEEGRPRNICNTTPESRTHTNI